MLTTSMVSLLRCPACKAGDLKAEIESQVEDRIEEGALVCVSCGDSFPVTGGVPDLVPRRLLDDEEWRVWTEHLDAFKARRDLRKSEPDRIFHRLARRAKPSGSHSGIAQPDSIQEGNVLDVGCGIGTFRKRLDLERVSYYGLDPIPEPAVSDFPFVRALAEHIPFQDDTFSHVVVRAALDHFQDIVQFLAETARVLRPGGQLHISQTIHEVHGPISAARFLLHRVKDAIEDRDTGIDRSGVPHHMNEFTRSNLLETVGRDFRVVAEKRYSVRWYSPQTVFISLEPRE